MDDVGIIEAIVLAGGRGTRLSSVVSDRPKVLADVGGRPFLTYLLDLLRHAGVRRAVLSVGYMQELVEEQIGPRHGSMEIVYSRETEPLGTGGGVRLAARLVQSDPAFVLNGDSYCHVNLAALVRFHRDRAARGTLTVLELPDTARYGRVKLDAAQRILRFEEKISGEPGYINAGVYVLSSAMLASIPAERPVSLEREMFPVWIESGLFGFVCSGPFLDIGTPESYSEAERFFARPLGVIGGQPSETHRHQENRDGDCQIPPNGICPKEGP
jgi:NDP-sugar pyrophosphorylase family protein